MRFSGSECPKIDGGRRPHCIETLLQFTDSKLSKGEEPAGYGDERGKGKRQEGRERTGEWKKGGYVLSLRL